MNTYECVLILPGKWTEENVQNMAAELKNLFVSCGTQEPEIVKLEKRRFSYLIKKQNEGYYLIFRFPAPPEALSKIKENIQHNEKILRYSFLKLKEKE